MKQLVCEMCGSTDLIKQDGVFVCQSCGTKYSLEEAKKMMIEGTVDVSGSTIKVDNTQDLNNLYQIARRAKDDGNTENARKYYDMILVKDPTSWEANFYAVYFQSMNCKIAEIQIAGTRLSNCESTVIDLVKQYVTNPNEQRKALDEIGARLIDIATMLYNAAHSHYSGISIEIRGKYTQEYVNNGVAARDILYTYGNLLYTAFGDKYGDIIVACYKVGVQIHKGLMPNLANKELNRSIINKYVSAIKENDPSYSEPAESSGGCYIATAVYGSYDCPQVWTLRRYRDYTLAKTWYGRAFIHVYYAISPNLVKWFGHTGWFKRLWKGKLDRMVANLKANGVRDTPYTDRKW